MSVVPQPESRTGNLVEWGLPRETGGAEAQPTDLARLSRLEQLEKALRHSEERLSLAMSASRGGFWDATCLSGRQIVFGDECYISPEQKRIIGFADHEFPNSGLAWLGRIIPEDVAALYQAVQQHYDSRTPLFQSEYRIRHCDGTLRWVEARGKLILDEDEMPRRCTGVVWDITERKIAEEERALLLAHRERQWGYLETLIAYAPVAIAVVQGPDSRVMLANQVFRSMAACGLNRPLTEMLPDAPNEFWEKLLKVRNDRQTASLDEYQTADREHQVKWWSVRFVPMHEAQGLVDTVLVILLEITEQVVARQRLADLAKTAESNYSQLEAVINSMSDGVIICAADGRIVRMNPAAKDLYGFQGLDVPRTLADLRQRVDLCDSAGAPVAQEQLPLSQVMAGRTLSNVDIRSVRKDMHRDWIGSYNGVAIRDGEGRVTMAVVTVRDVSVSRQHERQLRDWNETLEQRITDRTKSLLKYQAQLRDLTTELARAEQRTRKKIADDLHDWVAQDLVACRMKLGMASKLVRSPVAGDCLAEVDGLLTKSLSYMRTLIAELSPSVLYEAGLVAAFKHLGEQMAQYGLAVEVIEDGDTADLPEDEALLVFQSVRELLFNVVKHADVKNATVTTRRTPEGLTISVMDHGKGFDIHEDTKASTNGGKYGLFSLTERLEALGGWFSVESSPGNGTNATLLAPLRTPSMPRPQVEWPACPPDSGLAIKPATRLMRVVVADDHRLIRSGLRTLLDSYPDIHVIGEACNGEDAVEQAGRLRPDAIIMDVNMPRMNGIQATRAIKRDYPDITIIGLSVYNDTQIEAMMIEAGASLMLNKGGHPEDLYQALRETRAKPK